MPSPATGCSCSTARQAPARRPCWTASGSPSTALSRASGRRPSGCARTTPLPTCAPRCSSRRRWPAVDCGSPGPPCRSDVRPEARVSRLSRPRCCSRSTSLAAGRPCRRVSTRPLPSSTRCWACRPSSSSRWCCCRRVSSRSSCGPSRTSAVSCWSNCSAPPGSAPWRTGSSAAGSPPVETSRLAGNSSSCCSPGWTRLPPSASRRPPMAPGRTQVRGMTRSVGPGLCWLRLRGGRPLGEPAWSGPSWCVGTAGPATRPPSSCSAGSAAGLRLFIVRSRWPGRPRAWPRSERSCGPQVGPRGCRRRSAT